MTRPEWDHFLKCEDEFMQLVRKLTATIEPSCRETWFAALHEDLDGIQVHEEHPAETPAA
jgi:hypothetical protein